jgi:UDP-GlcNAc:undecaprenyl-phosphate GlcNAc-1-phosphate transferase
MRAFFAAFCASAVLSALLTPLVRILALRVGAVSVPGGRHVHRAAVPRFGGIAICIALIAPIVGLFSVESAVAAAIRTQSRQVLGLLVGASLMAIVGVIDDTRRMRALHKLCAQILAAIIAFGCGFRIEAVAVPAFGALPMGTFALPVTVLWIVGIVNAVNLIDGLDGLAAGVVFFAGLTNLVVAYLAGSTFVAVVMASLLGALFGFLFYNFNPAKIFMGDSGSYFIGYVLATTSLAGSLQKESTAVSLLVPMVALGVPITDTLFAIVRRFFEKRSIFSADRAHIHHRLLDLGITHRRAVMLIYGMSIVLTVAAIALALGRSWEVGLALLTASAVVVAVVRLAGYLEAVPLWRKQRAIAGQDTELLRRALIRLPLQLAEATTEGDVLEALASVHLLAKLASVELLDRGNNADRILHRCGREGEADREFVSSRYPLGPESLAVADIRYSWDSDFETVSPQVDALLRLSTDMLVDTLQRVSSPLVPTAAHGETDSPSEDDVVIGAASAKL